MVGRSKPATKAEKAHMEEWRHIPGWKGLYEISTLGRIKCLPRFKCRGGLLKPWVNVQTKYLMVTLEHKHRKTSGRKWKTYVHSLVLITFKGRRKAGMQCRHKNGVRSDNRLTNLQWGTCQQNAEDRMRHGTHQIGSQCAHARLTEAKVSELRSSDKPLRYFYALWGISKPTLCQARYKRTWKHLP